MIECLNCEVDGDPYDNWVCDCCYTHLLNEILKLKKERQEFLADLNLVLDHDLDYNDGVHIVDIMEKWENKLKDTGGI